MAKQIFKSKADFDDWVYRRSSSAQIKRLIDAGRKKGISGNLPTDEWFTKLKRKKVIQVM
jgi:hypothetical protein